MAQKRIAAWECSHCATVAFEWGRPKPRECRKCGCRRFEKHNPRKARPMQVLSVRLDHHSDRWYVTVTLTGEGVIGRTGAPTALGAMDAAKRIVAGVVLREIRPAGKIVG